jgi:hypothetical protein
MKRATILLAAAGLLLTSAQAFPQGEKQGQGQVVVTILPKHGEVADPVGTPKDLKLKVNGKDSTVTRWTSLRGTPLELVILIDGSARTSLGRQLSDIEQFVRTLPPNTRAAIAYMQNGNAVFAGPLTPDHAQILRGLHLPNGSAGSNSSPYFCLSDLAKRWPSEDRAARREVLMITDGVDRYNLRFDPEDPYVLAALKDALRARIIVYSIYWRDQGRIDASQYENNAGQSLLDVVTQATGGKSFWQGMGNPVSFQPFLDEFTRRLQNQYELSFNVPFDGKPDVERMKLKLSVPGSDISSPEQVFVAHPGPVQD